MQNDWQPGSMPTAVIGQIHRVLHKLVDQRLRAEGLSASQIPVLVALRDGRKLTQKELTAIAGVEQPSMAQLLGRMEKDGLIRREPDPQDGRKSLISLTEQALPLIRTGRGVLHHIDIEATSGLSDADRVELLRLLGLIAQAVRSDMLSLDDGDAAQQ